MIHKVISNILPYFPKGFVWQFSKRYVAGETVNDAINISKSLNANNILVTVDLLGEFITELSQAAENTAMYLHIIDEFTNANIGGSFSLKPTSFGLLLDEETCYNNIKTIVEKANALHSFVRIDMEDSSCNSKELRIFERLKLEFPNAVGIVLQAYMRNTMSNIKNLLPLNTIGSPLNIRLCKGIYVESEKIAYKGFQEIRDHFLADLEFMFKNKIYAAIATHDEYLVQQSYALIEQFNVSKSEYEFQMLYGVTPNLRDSIVNLGHPMRIYVPFGKDWFAYCTRRLKENPKMTNDIIKAVFIRG